jgi:hypothetical protein
LRVIGLTGGIACGKSTVSGWLREQPGCCVIDGDQISRQLTAPGGSALPRIRETFGDRVFLADGTLNRRGLGNLVFSHPAAREQLIFDRADCMDKRRRKVKRTLPELKKTYDRTYLDALGYLAQSPDNTVQSLKMLKKRLKDYFLEPGNSVPSPYLWKSLLRLAVNSPENLLKDCEQAETVDVSEYFA